LKLKNEEVLSNFAFNFNLRRYTDVGNQITYEWTLLSGPSLDFTAGTLGRGLHSSTFQLSLSRFVTEITQRISPKVLTLIRKMDECKPVTLGQTSGTPKLYISPHTLDFGSTYVFQIESKLRVAEFRKAQDTVTVVVGPGIHFPPRHRHTIQPSALELPRCSGAS